MAFTIKADNVHLQTAHRWFREDRMPVHGRRLESGTIWVDGVMADGCGRVMYARVSSHDQHRDLDRQAAQFTDWATRNGVERRQAALSARRRKVVVADPGETAARQEGAEAGG